MEEILASIRRIIADDQPIGAQPVHEPAAPEVEPLAAHAPAPPTAVETAPAATEAPKMAELPPEHGSVAAPQFASPEGPASLVETPHPLAPQTPEAAETVPATAATLDNAYEIAAPEPEVHEAALAALHEEPGVREAVLGHDVYEARILETQVSEEQVRELLEHQVRQPAAEEPPMSLREPPVTHHEKPEEPAAGLFSAATSQSLASAFNTLAISRLADDSQELRGLAREMLRPLLKDWLDQHLPGLVESIIREEIDRMARRGR